MIGAETTKRVVKGAYKLIPLKQPLFNLLRHVPVPTPVMRHLRFEGIITVQVDAGHSFRLHTFAAFIENDLFWRGYGNGWEGTSLKLWRQLVPQARTILDIGAHTGVYALAAKCLNPDATVVAFEPVARVFDKLESNIALNGYRVACEMLAASDRSGVATLFEQPGNTCISSLESRHLADERGVVAYEVATARIDDYLGRHGIPGVDLAKIDVEQHEPSVLRGFGLLLADHIPTLIVEVLTDAVAAEIGGLTAGLGYRTYQIVEQAGIRRIEGSRAGEGGRNLLLCQADVFERAELGRLLIRD